MILLHPVQASSFKKDVKRLVKRGKDMEKLKTAILLLVEQSSLPVEYGDHSLTGNWQGYRDLHLEPDWLLIYKIEKEDILYLARSGTHADIF